MTPYGLAGAIGHRWGETRPTTRISEYFNGAKLPRAGALRDLCNILGVSADWLLYGDGPMWRDGQRAPADWLADFEAHIQRRLCEGLKALPHDDRYGALRPEHLTVDGAALLDRTAKDLTAQFHGEADALLNDSLKTLASERQAELIVRLTAALPVDAERYAEAMRAAHILSVEAVHLVLDPPGPVNLTEAGRADLLEWWTWGDGADAAHTLTRHAALGALTAALDRGE